MYVCPLIVVLALPALVASGASQEAVSGKTPQPDAAGEPGTRRTDARGVEQVWVPAGSFLMGTQEEAPPDSPAWILPEVALEHPAHRVTLTTGFWLDRTEVTNAAFDAFVEDGGYEDPELWSEAGWAWLAHLPAASRDALPLACVENATPRQPRVGVCWYEAEAYARWRGGRLPTEAEWEFAARGPESRAYPWGDAWEPGRCHVLGAQAPSEVERYPEDRSWCGALDMAGNAMEWVADWLAPHGAEALIDPAGPAQGQRKMEKGGWWGAPAVTARGSWHYEDPPQYRDHHIGLRVLSPAG